MDTARIYELILNNEMSLICFQGLIQDMTEASYVKGYSQGYMDRTQDVDVLKQAFLAECG